MGFSNRFPYTLKCVALFRIKLREVGVYVLLSLLIGQAINLTNGRYTSRTI